MGRSQREKGKRGERDARDLVRELWQAPNCIRSAQVSGSFAADLLHGPAELHLEVKRYSRIAAIRWLEQAEKDSEQSGDVPTVLFREDGNTDWYVAIPMKDAERFARTLLRHLDTV